MGLPSRSGEGRHGMHSREQCSQWTHTIFTQAQAEQHANELLNQWEHAKKGLIAASG